MFTTVRGSQRRLPKEGKGRDMETIVLESLRQKLHPARFTEMSAKMSAIVGCVLGQEWTDPTLQGLCRTSDNFILGRSDGDIGFNEFIGTGEDLDRNWKNLLAAAELDTVERNAADVLFAGAFREEVES